MRHDELLMMTLAEIFDHQSGVNLIGGVDSIEDVIVQHQILVILEASDLLLLADTIDYFLILGQHIVKDDLLAQNVDDLIVINALGTADIGILVEPETFLKG